MELMKKIKDWLDGADMDDEPAAQSNDGPQRLPKREEFIIKVAREVARVMEEEKLEVPPDGHVMMPSKYIIFLSKQDDDQWRGKIREGLERGLHNLVSQRAKDLISDKPSNVKSLVMDIHVDGALNEGQIKVQPDWDEEEKTRVLSRKTNAQTRVPTAKIDADADTGDADDQTLVKPRAAPTLFQIEATRPNAPSQTHKFSKEKIAVGRSEKSDLRLEGDREISRTHIEIERLAAGRYSIVCLGQNGVDVNAAWLDQNQSREIEPGAIIKLGAYELKLIE
jgi:hypothetical protein